MARYRLLIKSSAARELEVLPKKKARRKTIKRIENLAEDPYPPESEKLSAQSRYRIRRGRCRITYATDDTNCEIVIFSVQQT